MVVSPKTDTLTRLNRIRKAAKEKEAGIGWRAWIFATDGDKLAGVLSEFVVDKTKYLTRAEVARRLGVSPVVVERVAIRNGVKIWQVPGHSRKWFDRRDVETLLAAADVSTGARA